MRNTARDNRLNTIGQIRELDANPKGEGVSRYFFTPSGMKKSIHDFRINGAVYPTFDTTKGSYFVTSENDDDGLNRCYGIWQARLVLDHLNDGTEFVVGVRISLVSDTARAYPYRSTAHGVARRLAAENRKSVYKETMITAVTHGGTSRHGNPWFWLTLMDGDEDPTVKDAAVNYGIENSAYQNTPVVLEYDGHGCVRNVELV